MMLLYGDGKEVEKRPCMYYGQKHERVLKRIADETICKGHCTVPHGTEFRVEQRYEGVLQHASPGAILAYFRHGRLGLMRSVSGMLLVQRVLCLRLVV